MKINILVAILLISLIGFKASANEQEIAVEKTEGVWTKNILPQNNGYSYVFIVPKQGFICAVTTEYDRFRTAQAFQYPEQAEGSVVANLIEDDTERERICKPYYHLLPDYNIRDHMMLQM